MEKKITIDNSRIYTMAGNRELVKLFPFLIKTTEEKRGCCKKLRKQPDYDHIRNSIAGLTDEQKNRFKAALGASEVHVFFKRNRMVEKVSF